jgi:hypothetical protein
MRIIPKLSPPNVFVVGPVDVFSGFLIETFGNDGLEGVRMSLLASRGTTDVNKFRE